MKWLGAVFLGLSFIWLAVPAYSDQLPTVPSPMGFIEGSALSAVIRDRAMAGHPASHKLIGQYFLPDALAEILKNRQTGLTAFCSAYIEREFSSDRAADDYFKELVKDLKKEGEQKFDRSNPAIDRILRRYEDAAKKSGGGITVKANGITVLGAIEETNSYYASALISSYTNSDGQRSAIMTFAIAVAWMRIGPRVLKLYVTYPFTGKASIGKANDALTGWVHRVAASNSQRK